MKASFIFIILLLFCRYSAAAEPSGLLIYCEPPATYVESVEYTGIERTNSIFSTVRRTDGKTVEIPNRGILGCVLYPTNSDSPGVDEEAKAALSKIDGWIAKYPQLRNSLGAAQTRWSNALTFRTGSRPKQVTVPTATASAISKLVVDGKTYSAVTLDSVRLDSVSISYSDGVANFPLDKLSPAQITALNGTSKTTQIPADWKQKLAKALEAQKKAAELAAANPPPNPTASAQEANRLIAGRSQPPTEAPKATGDDIDAEGHVAMPETLTEPVDGPGYQETLEFINNIIGRKLHGVGGYEEGQKLGYSEKADRMVLQSGIYNYLFDPTDFETVVKYGQRDIYSLSGATAQCADRKDHVVVQVSVTRLNNSKGYHVDSTRKNRSYVVFRCAPGDAERLANAVSSLLLMCGAKESPF